MQIKIKTTRKHRKNVGVTVGDYWIVGKSLQIRVSDLKNWRYEQLIAIHELLESLLCMERGIDFKEIDEFDKSYYGEGEPGDHPLAPYHKEHKFATKVEKMLCKEFKIKWRDYDRAVAIGAE